MTPEQIALIQTLADAKDAADLAYYTLMQTPVPTGSPGAAAYQIQLAAAGVAAVRAGAALTDEMASLSDADRAQLIAAPV